MGAFCLGLNVLIYWRIYTSPGLDELINLGNGSVSLWHQQSIADNDSGTSLGLRGQCVNWFLQPIYMCIPGHHILLSIYRISICYSPYSNSVASEQFILTCIC